MQQELLYQKLEKKVHELEKNLTEARKREEVMKEKMDKYRQLLKNEADAVPSGEIASLYIDETKRKQAEKTQRESEEKYCHIFENIQDVYYEVTLDGIILEVSPSIEEISAYKREDLKGKSLYDIYADPKKRDGFLRALLENEKVTDYETILKDKNGSAVNCSITGRLLRDEKGNPQKIVGTMRDITKRKKTEEALKESEEKYCILFENCPLGLGIADEAGNIIAFNDAMLRPGGYKRKDIGKVRNIAEFYYIPDDREEILSAAREQGSVSESDVRLKRKDGTPYDALLSLSPMQIGGRFYWQAMVQDVTERKRAEAALRESEAQKRAILDASLDRIRYIDQDMRIIWANKATTEGLDISSEGLVGQTCYEIFVGRDTPCEGCPAEKAKKTGQIERAVMYQRKVKGIAGESYWDTYCVPLTNEMGETESFVQVARNITDQTQAMDALRESEETLKAILAASPVGIGLVRNRTVDWANAAMYRILGYQEGPLSGEDAKVLHLNDEEWNLVRGELYPGMNETGIGQVDTRWIRKEGGVIDCHLQASPLDPDDPGKGHIVAAMDITDRKRAEEHIHALTQMLIKAQENERQRISLYLHDDVAQNLATLRIGLETIFDDPKASLPVLRQKVAQLSRILQTAISAVRDLAYDQRPPSLDQLGLIQAVFQYCESFSEKHGLSVDFRSAGMDDLKLDFDTEINLYRLIQEALTNVKKHADASHATVRLVAAHPHIILRIEDNGKGFDVQDRLVRALDEKRMGLQSIEERVNLLNGKLRIQSRLGEGTRIFVEVPYKEKRVGPEKEYFDH